MSILDKISADNITLELNGKTVTEVFQALAALIHNDLITANIGDVVEKLMKREELGSTGVGYELGLPHMRFDYLKETYVSFGLSREGIDFSSIDGKPVRFFFLVVAPDKDEYQEEYLQTMARITRLMREDEVLAELSACTSAEGVLEVFRKRGG